MAVVVYASGLLLGERRREDLDSFAEPVLLLKRRHVVELVANGAAVPEQAAPEALADLRPKTFPSQRQDSGPIPDCHCVRARL